ncbi:MAG: hypothetical protein OXI67_17975 [Candidatus Poribacteria bacterium]|nr:hypothetical protein [Candidatus Poribacteria bacterium]
MLKKLSTFLIFFLAFSFSVTLLGNDSVKRYFPTTLGSYWVYVDDDKNELTRHAVEGEEIAGETYHAFSYEPELEELFYFSRYIHPTLYQVNEKGITFVFEDEIEKALKTRLSKEMELLRGILELDDPDEANFTFTIDAKAQDHFYLLPTPVTLNEEWDVNEIKATLTIQIEEENEDLSIDFTILETGIVLGTETVKTSAGTFEDCLKVEYRTETTAEEDSVFSPEENNPPGETVTTVWFAPNVGIVKLHQISGYIFLDMIPDDADLPIVIPPNKKKTLELKNYEIKPDAAEGE